VAIGSLAIVIGASAAMFSFAGAMLLRPAPVTRLAPLNTATVVLWGPEQTDFVLAQPSERIRLGRGIEKPQRKGSTRGDWV